MKKAKSSDGEVTGMFLSIPGGGFLEIDIQSKRGKGRPRRRAVERTGYYGRLLSLAQRAVPTNMTVPTAPDFWGVPGDEVFSDFSGLGALPDLTYENDGVGYDDLGFEYDLPEGRSDPPESW